MIKRLLFLLILIFSIFNTYSADYYVSSSGTDSESNAGTELAPFETLQYAINQLTAGDILYVREGTYQRNNNY